MADDVIKIAIAWVVDGISTIFVTDEGPDSTWAVNAGFESTYPGLVRPTSLPCGTDLRSGMLTDDTCTIHVNDVDGSLVALFKPNKANRTALVQTLEPGDTGSTEAQGKHVGTEYIDGDGNRRVYSCIPGFNIGMLHYGHNEANANEVGVTWVSDKALLFEGRRCAVYLVKYVDGAWQGLGASKRLWWGQLRGRGEYKRGRWSFSCFGIQSWLTPGLGRGKFPDGIRAVPAFSIDTDNGIGEHIMYAALDIIRLDTFELLHDYGDTSVFQDTTSLVGLNTYSDVVAAVNGFLDVIVSDTTNGNAFNHNNDGNDIYFSTASGLTGITIQWKPGNGDDKGDFYVDAQADSPRLTARIRLWAHEEVWKVMGYDPRLQNSDRDPVANEDQYGQFQEVIGMPGYWQGAFYAASPKAMLAFETGDFDPIGIGDCSNGGNPRCWPPLYPGGAVSFTGEAGQEFYLDAFEPLLLAGSKSRPLPADPDDPSLPYTLGEGVGDVNAQAVLVLEGPYRRRGDEDQVDPIAGYAFEIERERREGRTVQVVRVGYRRNDDGTVAIGAHGRPMFVIYQWYDPRLFGINFLPLQGSWGAFRDEPSGAEPIRARPISVWDVGDGGDRISHVMQRVMLTTGTGGGWYSDESLTTPLYGLSGADAYFDVGDNDNAGAVPLDAEDASMGLGIPATMVASPEEFEAVEDSAIGPELRRCKVAATGVMSGRDLFARLLAPTGLAIGLSGGKYGIFDAWALPTPGDAVLSITAETYAGQAGKPESTTPQQGLRQYAAIDRIEVRARQDPTTKSYEREFERGATDSGVCYRGQHIKHQVLGDFLMSEKVSGVDWMPDLTARWRKGFEFWGADHSVVTVKLHLEDSLDVWPGDGVLFTDDQLLGEGVYGVNVAPGRVIHRDVNCEKPYITFKVLLGPESDFRMYAPSALVKRYDENDLGQGYRLLCEDDQYGDRPDGEFDVDGFAEPSWSDIGGQATIEIFQFDGTTWTSGIYGTVASVTSLVGNCSINLTGPLTGERFFRDKWSVVLLARWDEQAAAWVKRWYAPITESDGTHSSGTDGVPFMGL